MTPLFRLHLLERVYQSIPVHEDIIWHIAKSTSRGALNNDFIKTDPRIRVYEVDAHDGDTVAKRNVMFDQVKDGYFYLLDDDTLFCSKVYELYRHYQDLNFVGMIIGTQVDKKMRPRLVAAYPKNMDIDTGSVICHWTVLQEKEIRWEFGKMDGNTRDFIFWNKCFNYFGKEKTEIVSETVSIYNAIKYQ